MAGTSGYLATKSWNPYSVRNQRALFEAKEKERLQRERELKRALELKQERKEEAEARLIAAAQAGIRASDGGGISSYSGYRPRVDFMYKAPPGLGKRKRPRDDSGEGGSDSATASWGSMATDEAAERFFGRAFSGDAPDDRHDEDSDSIEDKQLTKHDKPGGDDHRSALEREAGVRKSAAAARPVGATMGELQERFEFLKDAPLVNRNASSNSVLRFKPLGKIVRNTKCRRCGEWGHQANDRECSLRNVLSASAEAAIQAMDPLKNLDVEVLSTSKSHTCH